MAVQKNGYISWGGYMKEVLLIIIVALVLLGVTSPSPGAMSVPSDVGINHGILR